MSTRSNLYVGYTVTLKTDLSGNDFNFFDEFTDL